MGTALSQTQDLEAIASHLPGLISAIHHLEASLEMKKRMN